MESLMQLCQSGGCAAKLGPTELSQILNTVIIPDANAASTIFRREDVGLLQLTPGLTLVQNVDVISPVTNDPYKYGAIAAAHALSDIYAKGATPRGGMMIMGFPPARLSLSIAAEIVQGAVDALTAAGALLLGGHTFVSTDVIAGLATFGTSSRRIVPNRSVRSGDLLVITKPLGVGLVVTATKLCIEGEIMPKEFEEFQTTVESLMLQTNARASELLSFDGVHACTDVSGFGLVGHLIEMLGSASASLKLTEIPLCPGAKQAITEGISSAGCERNIAEWFEVCELGPSTEYWWPVLFDPQTSGGLLISIQADQFPRIAEHCIANDILCAVIGQVSTEGDTCRIYVD
jgi:selenide,water dikinase